MVPNQLSHDLLQIVPKPYSQLRLEFMNAYNQFVSVYLYCFGLKTMHCHYAVFSSLLWIARPDAYRPPLWWMIITSLAF